MHARQSAIVTDATKATKAARRRKEPHPPQTPPITQVPDPIDYSKEVIPLEGELWESHR